MPKLNLTPLKTNENGARTKLIVATAITAAVITVAVVVAKKTAPVPVILNIVEDAGETVADAVKAA